MTLETGDVYPGGLQCCMPFGPHRMFGNARPLALVSALPTIPPPCIRLVRGHQTQPHVLAEQTPVRQLDSLHPTENATRSRRWDWRRDRRLLQPILLLNLRHDLVAVAQRVGDRCFRCGELSRTANLRSSALILSRRRSQYLNTLGWSGGPTGKSPAWTRSCAAIDPVDG
jgi:hypothetical protein